MMKIYYQNIIIIINICYYVRKYLYLESIFFGLNILKKLVI